MSDSDSDDGLPAARRERKEGEPQINLPVPDENSRNEGREQVSMISIKVTMPDGSVENLSMDQGATVEYVRAYLYEHFGVAFDGSVRIPSHPCPDLATLEQELPRRTHVLPSLFLSPHGMSLCGIYPLPILLLLMMITLMRYSPSS